MQTCKTIELYIGKEWSGCRAPLKIAFKDAMPGIEDTEQIQYEKLYELQLKNEDLARQLRQKIKLVGKS